MSSGKTFGQLLNINDLRQKTNESKNDLKKVYDEACEEAFNVILEGANEKMIEATEKGKTRAYLYIWHYLDDKEDKTFSFKNIRILDILTKGDLLDRLRNYFNPDNDENGYLVSFHKLKKQSDEELTKYGLYVSWYLPKEPKEPKEQKENKDFKGKKDDKKPNVKKSDSKYSGNKKNKDKYNKNKDKKQ